MRNVLYTQLKRKIAIATNIHTSNVATATESGDNTTGFAKTGAGTVTFESSTEQSLPGKTKSLKVICNGAEVNQGVKVVENVVSGSPYTEKCYIYAPEGADMEVTFSGSFGANSTLLTGNGEWQEVKNSSNCTGTGTTNIMIRKVTAAGAPFLFYVGRMIFRKANY